MYSCHGQGGNQAFTLTRGKELKTDGDLCVDAKHDGTALVAILRACAEETAISTQLWTLNADGETWATPTECTRSIPTCNCQFVRAIASVAICTTLKTRLLRAHCVVPLYFGPSFRSRPYGKRILTHFYKNRTCESLQACCKIHQPGCALIVLATRTARTWHSPAPATGKVAVSIGRLATTRRKMETGGKSRRRKMMDKSRPQPLLQIILLSFDASCTEHDSVLII